MNLRIGADIGGTFTDLILIDDSGKTFQVGKVLTTPAQPDDAVLIGIGQVLAEAGVDPGSVSHVVHGTTLLTNALIERKGARTALVSTEGFRDILAMRREIRYDVYDIAATYPEPLVPRPLRREVRERVVAARRLQERRGATLGIRTNAEIPDRAIDSLSGPPPTRAACWGARSRIWASRRARRDGC